jgi:hypothetical protein
MTKEGGDSATKLHIDPQHYNQSWLDSHHQPSLYSLKFDKFRKAKKEILKWRELVHKKIPEYYSLAKDDMEKEELQRFSDYAKRKYGELLKEYKHKFARDSFFKSGNFQSFELDLVTNEYKDYSKAQHDTDLNDRLLQSEEDIRLYSQNNLIKLVLLSRKNTKKELTNEQRELTSKWNDSLSNHIFEDIINIIPEIIDCSINEIFSEKDFETFANIFPHTNLKQFGSRSISDLLSFLNLGMSPTYVDISEKLLYADQLKQSYPDICSRSLLINELPMFNNIGKFLSVFTENYTTLLASNFDEQERKDIMHLYGFKKEKERNLTWTKTDITSFQEFMNDLPLLQNPYNSIHDWIELKEKESHLRNAKGQGEIQGLTISDSKMTLALSNKTWNSLNDLSQSFFKKNYHEVTTADLSSLTEYLLERFYLLKRNPPLNFFEILHFILNHENLHPVDKVNLLETMDLFDISLNKIHMGQILAEYPIVPDDTTFISNRFSKMRIDEVVMMANYAANSHEQLYLIDE